MRAVTGLPSEDTRFHEKVTLPSPGVAVRPAGRLGTMSMSTGADRVGVEAPTALYAVTSNTWSMPRVRPSSWHWVTAPQCFSSPCVTSRTTTSVTGEPLKSMTFHTTVAEFLLVTRAPRICTGDGLPKTESLNWPRTDLSGSPVASMSW